MLLRSYFLNLYFLISDYSSLGQGKGKDIPSWERKWAIEMGGKKKTES